LVGGEVDSVGDCDDARCIGVEAFEIALGEGGDGDEDVGGVEGCAEALGDGAAFEAGVVFADVAAVAGDDEGDVELFLAEAGEVAGGVDVVAMDDVEVTAGVKALEEDAVPGDEIACGDEAGVPDDGVREFGIVGAEGPAGLGGEDDGVVAELLEVSGEGIDDGFLSAELGEGGGGVKTDAHLV